MPRVASPFSDALTNLNGALKKLKKYADDPEWKEYPDYQSRIRKNVEAARVYFGKIMDLVGAESTVVAQEPKKKGS